MSLEMHVCVEKRENGKWGMVSHSPFEYDNYRVYGWLGDFDNRSAIHSPFANRGFPLDISEGTWGDAFCGLPYLPNRSFDRIRSSAISFGYEGVSESYVLLAELLAIDYEQVVWDRAIKKDGKWGIAQEGEGEHLPLGEFLGELPDVVGTLKKLGDPQEIRLLYWYR